MRETRIRTLKKEFIEDYDELNKVKKERDDAIKERDELKAKYAILKTKCGLFFLSGLVFWLTMLLIIGHNFLNPNAYISKLQENSLYITDSEFAKNNMNNSISQDIAKTLSNLGINNSFISFSYNGNDYLLGSVLIIKLNSSGSKDVDTIKNSNIKDTLDFKHIWVGVFNDSEGEFMWTTF